MLETEGITRESVRTGWFLRYHRGKLTRLGAQLDVSRREGKGARTLDPLITLPGAHQVLLPSSHSYYLCVPTTEYSGSAVYQQETGSLSARG